MLRTNNVATESIADVMRERLAGVRSRIDARAHAVGRDPADVTLIAVSKTHPPNMIRSAIDAGIQDFGENRVQEAEPKIGELGRESARWHLIGHLQGNKARRAVPLFDVIHSVDSESLAVRLDRVCDEVEREELSVLIQVDLAHEATKSGVFEKDLAQLVDLIGNAQHLRLCGLMIVPPMFEDAEVTRPYFRRLRQLRDELAGKGAFGTGPGHLSMGMSHDFEVAIEEGATMVRVGTAIFGERGPTP